MAEINGAIRMAHAKVSPLRLRTVLGKVIERYDLDRKVKTLLSVESYFTSNECE